MALIDLSEVFDPLFTSTVMVFGHQDLYDEFGNFKPEYLDGVELEAIVTSDQRTLQLLPEMYRRVGTVIVRYKVSDAPAGFNADINDKVQWREKVYSVIDRSSGEQYGQGFVKLICTPDGGNDGH